MLQKRDHRRAAGTNTYIENPIIIETKIRNVVDDDSGWTEDILPVFSHDSGTAQEGQTSLVIFNDDKNLINASSPKEEIGSLVHDWSFEDKLANFLRQNPFHCRIPHITHQYVSKNGCFIKIIAKNTSSQFRS